MIAEETKVPFDCALRAGSRYARDHKREELDDKYQMASNK